MARKTLGREHPDLIASSKGLVIEAGVAWLELDMTSQAVARRCDRDDANQRARAVVDQVGRNDDARTQAGWLMADRNSEIDFVDFAPPDQASESHSSCSAKSASRLSRSNCR